MHQDIWSILILFLIAQGLFVLSVFLLSSKRRRKQENRYLFLLVTVFIWFLVEFYTVRNVIKLNFDLFYGTRYGSWLLLGPLTFFFFKAVSISTWKFNLKSVLHLTPFLIFALLIPLLSGQSLSSRQIHYGMLAVFDHRPKVVTSFEYLYSSIFYLQFLHFAAYLVLNIQIIKRYAKRLKNEYAALNDTLWLYIFNLVLISSLILASIYLYILFASDAYSRSLDYIYVLPMGLFIYAVGYRLSGIEWLQTQEPKKRYESSTLKPIEKQVYKEKLEQLMQQEKPHLKNDLRLKDLAALLHMPNHHLSQLLNESYDSSFFDFINKYRIKEAKQLISMHPNYTLLQVAFDAGFNNKTSFVNAFKKFEQQTPSSFRKAHIAALKT